MAKGMEYFLKYDNQSWQKTQWKCRFIEKCFVPLSSSMWSLENYDQVASGTFNVKTCNLQLKFRKYCFYFAKTRDGITASLVWSAFIEGKNVSWITRFSNTYSVPIWQPSPGDRSQTGWNSQRKSVARGLTCPYENPLQLWLDGAHTLPSRLRKQVMRLAFQLESVKEARLWLMTVAAVWYHHRCSPIDSCQWPVCLLWLLSSGQWLFDFNLQPQDFNICLSWKQKLLYGGRARRATYRWSDRMKENIHLNWIRLWDVVGPCCPHDNLFFPSRRDQFRGSPQQVTYWPLSFLLLSFFFAKMYS